MVKTNFEWETKANKDDTLYREGKKIAQRMADFGITEADEHEFRAYIDDLTEAELRAYAYYDENRTTQE